MEPSELQGRTANQQQRFTNAFPMLKIKLSIIVILTILLVSIIFLGADRITLNLHRKHQQPLTGNLVGQINSFIIQNYTHSAANLATINEIVEVCAGHSSIDNPHLLRVLNTAQRSVGVALVYVMDITGAVIGCSNGSNEISLTGNRYPFRPYFFNALSGKPYLFPAVGITTKRKGFYFSAPVYHPNTKQPSGVVVIKTRSESIDSLFSSLRGKFEAFLLSPDGVVFTSTQENWNFCTAWPLTEKRLAELKASRQFDDSKLPPLPFSLQNNTFDYNRVRFSVDLQPLQIEGWQIATLVPVSFPWTIVILFCCVALSLGALSCVVVLHDFKEKQLAGQVVAGQEASDKAEAAHRASVRELETIFSASLVGIILVRDGKIINANNRMTEMFGYSRKEIVEGDIHQFFPERKAFRRFVREHLHLLIESDVEQVEYLLKRKDGRTLPCTLSGKAINTANLSQGTVWVIEDITKRKNVEKELEQAKVAAEAASVAKSEFLANMSHEIRTPMNGIIGLSNILLRGTIPDSQREHIELIQRSAIRLMTIINDILDFSKLEAGRFELEKQPFSLRSVLKEVMQPVEPTAHRKNLQLKLMVAPDVPEVLVGDQTKLMQVLTNLIDNSLKFTRNGYVTVRVRLQRKGNPSGDKLLFEVVDTGIGIVPAYHAKVFESFSQADSSHSRKFGGTGLGLSITKGLVELMGGEIWFDSEPNIGTRFYFTLPFVKPDSVPHTPIGIKGYTSSSNEFPLPTGQGKRILVAEDEYINKILMSTLLKQAGYHVTVVANGREAVDAWRGGVFDCILMDIQMPEMDGYEAVARIREAEKEDEHIPVIAMTAHAMSGDRKKCLNAGMDDYVAKPIDGEIVLQLLRQYLSPSQDADAEISAVSSP
jgi:PAS domain S-box-containing protein